MTFCSVLIRRELVEAVGPMDGSMITYYSDSDYCLTARHAGFRVGYAGQGSFVFHRVGQSAHTSEAQRRIFRQDHMAFWNKWISGEGHSVYLGLMSDPSDERRWRPDELRRQAGAFPELQAWLGSLPPDQKIKLGDILDHFQYRKPQTAFSILCNIAAELVSPG